MNDDDRGGLTSASGAEIFEECPGSVQFCKDLPADLPEQATTDGTLIHTALETGDTSGLDPVQAEIAENLSEMELTVLKQWLEDNPNNQTPVCERERRYWFRDPKTLEPIHSAKCDVVYLLPSERLALIIDAKTGYRLATAAERNKQLRSQALAVWMEYPYLRNIRLCLAAYRFQAKYDIVEYTIADLHHAEAELIHAIWKTKQPGAQRIPGDHCRYCRGKAYCPEAAAFTSVITYAPQTALADNVEGIVQKMGVEQLAFVQRRSTVIKSILSAISTRLKTDFTEEQLQAVGLRLKPGAKRTEILDNQKAWESLESHLSRDELMICISLSIDKAIRTMMSHTGDTYKATKEKVMKALEGNTVINQNQSSLEVING